MFCEQCGKLWRGKKGNKKIQCKPQLADKMKVKQSLKETCLTSFGVPHDAVDSGLALIVQNGKQAGKNAQHFPTLSKGSSYFNCVEATEQHWVDAEPAAYTADCFLSSKKALKLKTFSNFKWFFLN